MYKRILLPHGGTKASDKALKHAIHIAKASNAKIEILRIADDVYRVPTLGLAESQRLALKKELGKVLQQNITQMENELSKVVKLCKENGIEATEKVVKGDATDEILKYTKNHKIDLIVMSKRRKLPGIKRLLTLGSVSRKIVENAPCPVLLMD